MAVLANNFDISFIILEKKLINKCIVPPGFILSTHKIIVDISYYHVHTHISKQSLIIYQFYATCYKPKLHAYMLILYQSWLQCCPPNILLWLYSNVFTKLFRTSFIPGTVHDFAYYDYFTVMSIKSNLTQWWIRQVIAKPSATFKFFVIFILAIFIKKSCGIIFMQSNTIRMELTADLMFPESEF